MRLNAFVLSHVSRKNRRTNHTDRDGCGNSSNDNPQKDNFHNAILGIDKTDGSGIVDLTFPINFLFPEGVMDRERPLESFRGVEFFLYRCDFNFFPAWKCFRGLSN